MDCVATAEGFINTVAPGYTTVLNAVISVNVFNIALSLLIPSKEVTRIVVFESLPQTQQTENQRDTDSFYTQ